MTLKDLEAWQKEFEQFHARFADLFQRSESREQAKKYLRGLLAQVDRKNSWQVAEAVGERLPDRMQRLLYRVPWDADAARDRLQQFVIETFGEEDGIGVVDETALPLQERSPELRLVWSLFRRRKRFWARRSHYQRRSLRRRSRSRSRAPS
jgi:SRSO17 transposase